MNIDKKDKAVFKICLKTIFLSSLVISISYFILGDELEKIKANNISKWQPKSSSALGQLKEIAGHSGTAPRVRSSGSSSSNRSSSGSSSSSSWSSGSSSSNRSSSGSSSSSSWSSGSSSSNRSSSSSSSSSYSRDSYDRTDSSDYSRNIYYNRGPSPYQIKINKYFKERKQRKEKIRRKREAMFDRKYKKKKLHTTHNSKTGQFEKDKIGIVNGKPIYYIGDTIVYSVNGKYQKRQATYNIDDDKYYLKDNDGSIIGIIEKDKRGRFRKFNKDGHILAHLNRNRLNKEACGDLAQLRGNLFIDEKGCVFEKKSVVGSMYHSPLKNVKFTRKSKNGWSYETVKKLTEHETRTNLLFEGKNVRSGPDRGTFNFYDASPAFEYALSWLAVNSEDPWKKSISPFPPGEYANLLKHPHMLYDEDLHKKGYTEYAIFPEQHDEPTDEEKMIVLSYSFPDRYNRSDVYKEDMEYDFKKALIEIHANAKKREVEARYLKQRTKIEKSFF